MESNRNGAVRRAAIALAFALQLAPPAGAAPAARPYTIDDELKVETVGKGLADPTGRWMAWELSPPYDQQPDYSVDHTGTFIGAYRLQGIDLGARKPVSKPFFDADPARQYWLDSFSPDGKFLAFYTAKQGRFGMGVVELATRRVRYIDHAPDIDWYAGRESVWVGNDKFVYAPYGDGGQPTAGWRRAFGDRMQAAWQKSWAGKDASVTDVESGADPALSRFKPGRLLLVDARSGAVETIGAGMYRNLALSPDGKTLAALRQARKLQLDPGEPDTDWTWARSELVLFDLANRTAPRVVTPDLDVFEQSLAWSSDGKRLAYFAWPAGDRVRNGRFRALDVATGEVATYAHLGLDLASARERGKAQKPERVVWIGDRLAIAARETGDGAAHFSDRDVRRDDEAAAARIDWFLVDRTGLHEKLTGDFKLVSPIPLYADARSFAVLADGAVWMVAPGRAPQRLPGPDGMTLSLTRQDQYDPQARPFTQSRSFVGRGKAGNAVVFVDFQRRTARAVPVQGAEVSPLAVSAATGSVLVHDQSAKSDTVLLQRGEEAPTALRRINAHLETVARPFLRRLDYRISDENGAHDVAGCVLLPPDFQPGRRYPVIVDVYPGRGPGRCSDARLGPSSLDTHPTVGSADLFATQGYIYFTPAMVHELIWRKEGPLNGMTNAALQAVDALVAQGYADPARVGLYGVSQGGFASLWVTTQTDRFKATVSLNGWSDMYTHYFETDYVQRLFPSEQPYIGSALRYMSTVGGDFGIGRTPYQDPDAYVRNSPLFNADKVKTPLLLIHSDLDILELSQYERMFTALYQQRKEARLLEYWGEGHSPSSPANIRHAWNAMLGWYDKYLDVGRDAQGRVAWAGDQVRGR